MDSTWQQPQMKGLFAQCILMDFYLLEPSFFLTNFSSSQGFMTHLVE